MASPDTGSREPPWRAGLFRSVILACLASVLLFARGAGAADLPTQLAPSAPATPAATPCFATLYDFLSAGPEDCPLAWRGITLYGRLDYGAGYETHGAPIQWQLSQWGRHAH